MLAGARLLRAEAPSSAYLALPPEGEAKRKFILDCTGCHLFDGNIAFPASEPRTREGWEEAVRRMIGYAGAGPIPYDLRVAPDGSVWGTELHGNRIFRFDPRTERFQTHTLPTAASPSTPCPSRTRSPTSRVWTGARGRLGRVRRGARHRSPHRAAAGSVKERAHTETQRHRDEFISVPLCLCVSPFSGVRVRDHLKRCTNVLCDN